MNVLPLETAVARSSFRTSLTRYSYSWGLWVMLLLAPVAARFMVADDQGFGMQVAIGGHLPILTSPTLGITLGIIVSTLLLPIGFLYLRSNVTRQQPWQIEEVSPASRVAITLGRFGADVAILFAILAALTLAGWFLGWLVGSGPLNIWHITLTLWVVAAPALMIVAAIRILFDAMKWTRGGLGETLYFILWLGSIIAPAASSGQPSSYGVNMVDMPGFSRPLEGPTPKGEGNFTIGSTDIQPGRVPIDPMLGVNASGYLAARATWVAIAIALAAFAGLIYRPHVARHKGSKRARLARWLSKRRPPRPANPAAPPAPFATFPFIGLATAEFRLIGQGLLFTILAVAAAGAGLLGDYRHIGSPAAMLLLIFGLVAHAGRSETLHKLGATFATAPMTRRLAFILAGTFWALLMAVPAAIKEASAQLLLLGLATGAAISLIAITLGAISRSAFAPRLVLLILWYGYFST